MCAPAALSDKEVLSGFSSQDQFEFLEITNYGNKEVNKKGLQFTKGFDSSSGLLS